MICITGAANRTHNVWCRFFTFGFSLDSLVDLRRHVTAQSRCNLMENTKHSRIEVRRKATRHTPSVANRTAFHFMQQQKPPIHIAGTSRIQLEAKGPSSRRLFSCAKRLRSFCCAAATCHTTAAQDCQGLLSPIARTGGCVCESLVTSH